MAPRDVDPKSHFWRDAGITKQLSARVVKRARIQFFLVVSLIAGTLVAYDYRRELFGLDEPVRVVTVIALIILGWSLARDVGRWLQPALFKRLDAGTAGTVGFMIRLATIVIALLVALRVAGLEPSTLAVGGAFTAVIVGLAAQQTLGNLFAGLILLSARPFRAGDRVRLKGGNIGGQIEGDVTSWGCSTRSSPAARTRSWSRTTSCSTSRSSRCASRPASTCARACAPASPRSTSRSSSRRRSRRRSAASRRSRSRSSTARRSSCGSPRRPSTRPTGLRSRARCWPPSGRRRGASSAPSRGRRVDEDD